ncbi:MAG: gamma-glutamyltransferase [Thermoanaerobaculia bacterium]|nr:gamma-glutamyltransferase [Thermoanaerobaculia bacterium]
MMRGAGFPCGVTLALFLAASHLHAGSTVIAKKAALSTASPAATSVGLHVLRNGGNAMDAAVAVSFALAVVHPQAGNLGGGGFLVYYDAESKSVWTLDFRETAPRAATATMYVQPDGTPSTKSRTGARASGVPGTVRGLAAAHKRFGSRSWKELIAPAASIAREGFRVDDELQRELGEEKSERCIDQFPSTAAIFFPGGKPAAAGSTLVQKDLATTLERIAVLGPNDFYEGETAKRIVEGIHAAGGILAFRDLRDYQPVWRAPVKVLFRGYEIYTMAPPSAGGFIVGSVLNILSGFDLEAAGFQTATAIHLQAEASRRAYIDRNRYLGDPAMTRIPYRELLSSERAAQWRASIDPQRATPTVTLMQPAAAPPESSHTTHFSIADEAGNIASMTTTLNENFGSGFIVPGAGFFLNNEMDDFTTAPGKPNRYGMVQGSTNAIEPGKRMVSSMTPVIVMKDARPFLVLGSRGGPAIPTTVLQVILNVIVFGKSLPDAVAAPRFHHQGLPEEIFYEYERAPEPLLAAIRKLGHGVRAREPIGDVHALQFQNGTIVAVADPRRGGAAGGY